MTYEYKIVEPVYRVANRPSIDVEIELNRQAADGWEFYQALPMDIPPRWLCFRREQED